MTSLTRRHFLGTAAAATTAFANGGALPTRTLGRTGATPSILAIGCGSRLLSYGSPEAAVDTLNLAINSGVTYIDTAQGYGNGKSESWVGEVMKTRRDEVFLATKTLGRTYDEVMSRMDGSLDRLQTGRVDVLHIHGLKGPEDLEKLKADGAMKALYKIRDQKMARFIGITSHTDPTALAEALEIFDFDCTQMALNAALQGMQNGKGKMILNPAMTTSFEDVALPVARKKNIGVIAMKVFGQEDLLPAPDDAEHAERLLRYSLSLPGVAVAVAGCPKHEYLRLNVASARAYQPMPKKEMQHFSDGMSERYKQALDLKFQDHIDA